MKAVRGGTLSRNTNRKEPVRGKFPLTAGTETMKFTKMHGIGNDYIYIDCVTPGEDLSLLDIMAPSRLAELLSDRHFGIGSDGLILIRPSENADFCMEMYNSDGSRGSMCGNGIRCVAKYVYDHGLTNMTTLTIETPAGIKTVDLTVKNGRVTMVKVDMGIPVLTSNGQKTLLTGFASDPDAVKGLSVWERLSVQEEEYPAVGISMGNPHEVLFCEDAASAPVTTLGPAIESQPLFPDRTNVEFVHVVNRGQLDMRVWERGSGETLACGTGACAAAVAAVLADLADRTATIHLPGGSLKIYWNPENGVLEMSGPATEVYHGWVEL